MNKFKILADSSCDLPENIKSKYNIELIPFHVSFDYEKYYKENIDISVNEFYKKIKTNDNLPKTSLPSIQEYADAFKKHLNDGFDILCICITSKFSGSYQSAINAANILNEEYPERKIIIIDSMQVTAGQGLLVIEAAKMHNDGFKIEEVAEKINQIKLSSKIIFTVDSLNYLQKGGRIGKVSAIAGSLLSIKPIIFMKDGELIPNSKVRGRKKALSEVINIVYNDVKNNIDNYNYTILHADCIEDALILQSKLKDKGIEPNKNLFNVGITIGSHIGPTAIGIAYIKKYTNI